MDPMDHLITLLINLGNALIQSYRSKREIKTVRDVLQVSGQEEADRFLQMENEVQDLKSRMDQMAQNQLELKETLLNLKELVLSIKETRNGRKS